MGEKSSGYVEKTPEGGWRIAGSRVSLDSIVHAYWAGRMPESIAGDFPALSLEQIHGAIAYYLKHRGEIDTYLAAQQERWEELREESEKRHSRLLQRIRSSAQETKEP